MFRSFVMAILGPHSGARGPTEPWVVGADKGPGAVPLCETEDG